MQWNSSTREADGVFAESVTCSRELIEMSGAESAWTIGASPVCGVARWPLCSYARVSAGVSVRDSTHTHPTRGGGAPPEPARRPACQPASRPARLTRCDQTRAKTPAEKIADVAEKRATRCWNVESGNHVTRVCRVPGLRVLHTVSRVCSWCVRACVSPCTSTHVTLALHLS